MNAPLLPAINGKLRFAIMDAKPLAGKGRLNTAEWWQMPWGGYPFTVPVDADGQCEKWALNRLILDIIKSAPSGWEFPDS